MTPDFRIGGQKISIDSCPGDSGQVIYPRVRMGRDASQELQKQIKNLANVEYDPSKTYVAVVPQEGVATDLVIAEISKFLERNHSMWFLIQ